MHTALICTTSDFPAYGNLSGWKTKEKYACPYCNIGTCSPYLKGSRKMCYVVEEDNDVEVANSDHSEGKEEDET